MLVGIISDIHDNEVNLNKFLKYAKDNKLETIICCGDVTNSMTLNTLANFFAGQIFLVQGNQELYDEKEVKGYENIQFLGQYGNGQIENKNFAACHEPREIKLLQKEGLDFIFYGHTHRPWLEERDGIRIANPGTLGGVFQKATFAIWDTNQNTLELKILELI